MYSVPRCSFFFFYSYGDHRDLHSFPTRRSSDLGERVGVHDARRCAQQSERAPADHDLLLVRLFDQRLEREGTDRKSTRLNSSHLGISYAVFCLKKKKTKITRYVKLIICNHRSPA